MRKATSLRQKKKTIYVDKKYKNKANKNHRSLWFQVLNEVRAAKILMLQILGIKIPLLKTGGTNGSSS